MITRKNVELYIIFNLVHFEDLKFAIFQIELQLHAEALRNPLPLRYFYSLFL
jgi:hypothetical protein